MKTLVTMHRYLKGVVWRPVKLWSVAGPLLLLVAGCSFPAAQPVGQATAFVVSEPAAQPSGAPTAEPSPTSGQPTLDFSGVDYFQAPTLDLDSPMYSPPLVQAPVGAPCVPPSGWTVHSVQPGDTLFRLGQLTGSSVSALQHANCLLGTTIYVGQILHVPHAIPETELHAILVPAASTGEVTDSPTATGTASPAHTPTSYVQPGQYQLYDKCTTYNILETSATIYFCVDSVDVHADGQMHFNVIWAVSLTGSGLDSVVKYSDTGNTNMYITDDRKNRYDFIALSGAAALDTTFQHNSVAFGAYVFPPPAPDASVFTFRDEDQGVAIWGIELVH